MNSLVALVGVVLVASAGATPLGAPAVCCIPMIPGHGAQSNDTCPFQTVPDVTSIAQNGVVRLTMSVQDVASNATFRGFLIRANMVGMEDRVVGQFIAPSDGRVIDCLAEDGTLIEANAAATHNDRIDKTEVTVDWVPNGFSGNVVFQTTYVQDVNIYWLKEQSTTVTVN